MTEHSGDRRSDLRVAVIGAGPGGICAGIKLEAAGISHFTIFDRADDVGGTWRRNRYPGAACDVTSHLYSFSFEIKHDWSRPFAHQPELLEYFRHCVRKYGLEPHLRLGTAVTGLHWDDECCVWRVVTDRRDVFEFDAVIGAVGMFGAQVWPDIDGLADFKGITMHSAQWDASHDLSQRRVAVIGSAASAVQLIPEVAAAAKELKVFQRTANWVLPKDDTPYTAEELEHFRNDPMASRTIRNKAWCTYDEIMTLTNKTMLRVSEEMGLQAISGVEDPELRAKLTPTHPFGCKRPLMSNEYYPTFNRDNVELVTDPIANITADAIVTTDGLERHADTIVLATGFDTTRYLSAIEVTGRRGRRLADDWSDGPEAYLGVTVAGYPNLFMLYGPNTNNGTILFMIECQVAYAIRQIERLRDEGLAWLEVKRDAVTRHNTEIQHALDGIEVWQAGCPGYYRSATGRIVTQWPLNMTEYRTRTLRPDPECYDACSGGVLAAD